MKTVRLNTIQLPEGIKAFLEANPDIDGEDYGMLAGAMEYLENASGKRHTKIKTCIACGSFFRADSKNFPPEKTSADGLDYKCRPCHRTYVNWKKMKKRRDGAMGSEDVSEIERHRQLMEQVKEVEVNF
jgi:hypothetical protein